MRNIISFLFSLEFSVKCDLDMVRLIHMADTQSCRNRVFCYICLLCLCSSAHLYRRTPSIPACPQHALSPPQDTLMVPCLSLFSLFPLPIPCSISLWHNMGQLSDRARDLSVLLTLSLFKSKWNAQNHFTCSCDVQYLQVKQDIQWDQEYILCKLISWILEWSMSAGVCCCSYWLINLQKWLVLDVVLLCEFCYKASNTLSVCLSELFVTRLACEISCQQRSWRSRYMFTHTIFHTCCDTVDDVSRWLHSWQENTTGTSHNVPAKLSTFQFLLILYQILYSLPALLYVWHENKYHCINY